MYRLYSEPWYDSMTSMTYSSKLLLIHYLIWYAINVKPKADLVT